MKFVTLSSQISNGNIQIGRGQIISSKDMMEDPGDYPIYSSSAKGKGEFGRYGKYMFDEELITWSIDGGGRFFYRPKHKFSVTNVCGYMRLDSTIWDYRFVYYCLDLQQKRIGFDYQMKAHPSVIRNLYSLWEIPKQEQVKIGQILSTIENAILQTEELILKEEFIKKGLMQDLLTRGIDTQGNLRSEETHKFKDSLLGRIPSEWELTLLDSIAETVTSGARGWARFYSNEGAIFLRIGNLTRQHINLRLDDLTYVNSPNSAEVKRTMVREGDLLISVTADLGIIGIIPAGFSEAYINQHIALVRLDMNRVNPRYVGWFLSSNGGQVQFDRLNESGAKAGLNLPTVRKLLFPLMPLEEQRRISEILDSSFQRIEHLRLELRKLLLLKTGLMQDLLTGKKRVTDLIDNEEAIIP